jgi:hypothetical protein
MNPPCLPRHIVDRMRPEDRKALGLQTTGELIDHLADRDERKMQARVEGWLRQRGYWPRTGAYLAGSGKPSRGWYIHLNRAKRNPFLLDLLVVGLDGRCIEVELKTMAGRVRPEQAAILAAGGSVALCRSAQEAIDRLAEWDEGTNGLTGCIMGGTRGDARAGCQA